VLELFRSLIDRTKPHSTSRALAVWSGVAFILSMVGIAAAITFRITKVGDVGTGACAALACVSAPLAALVASVYRAPSTSHAASGTRAGGVLDPPAPIEGGKA
jgi:hypothetical protein